MSAIHDALQLLIRHSQGASSIAIQDLDYILGCFSQIAYTPTPFDIADGRYSKLIPSLAFQQAVTRSDQIDPPRVLSRLFGPEFEPAVRQVISANSVTTIFRLPNVVVIAVRGTVLFHHLIVPHRDLAIDLTAIRAPRSFRLNENNRYHLGFLTEAERILPLVRAEYDSFAGDPIYFTGHSLGGALAAVLDRLWEVDRAADRRTTTVFGCPRFGNAAAVAARPLRALVRRGDPVPGVPKRWMGYADPTDREVIHGVDGWSWRPWANHFMEGYRQALALRTGRLDRDERFFVEFLTALARP